MILHDVPEIVLQHDPATALLRAAWRAHCPLARFVPVLLQLVEFSRQRGIRHWLMNIDQLPPLGQQEQAWIFDTWFPLMATTPVEHLALVLPAGLHNQLVATAPVFDRPAVMSFELHFFADDESAFSWISEGNLNGAQLRQEWALTVDQTQHGAANRPESLPAGS
ncbi:hypothetical protein [Hymenobacter latericus]|uniref:hypothetical protein n=1 Tax=Hymenobacter sp. YIM 151858-1 TaxID=2987688 RepID=UPI0022263647|nr:hypothetical protein [Hymenobacter sp. YIM 151858-1]UYZ58783.1 hypothetical protein OIS50_17195 [Hymenobacter sp. YIM 151858-1]